MKRKVFYLILLYKSIALYSSQPTKELSLQNTISLEYLSANISALKQEVTTLRQEQIATKTTIASLQDHQRQTTDNVAQIRVCQTHQGEHLERLSTEQAVQARQFDQSLALQVRQEELITNLQQQQTTHKTQISRLEEQQACHNETIILLQSQQQKQRDDHVSINATLTETNAALRHIVAILEISHKHSKTGLSLSLSPCEKIDRPCRRKTDGQKPAWRY